MMEGPRHQHLHQELQEPLEEPFVQLALRCGRNWAARWHLACAAGKRFRGCRAKRLYVH